MISNFLDEYSKSEHIYQIDISCQIDVIDMSNSLIGQFMVDISCLSNLPIEGKNTLSFSHRHIFC